MPNGEGKNWARLFVAMNGFRAKYGRWPTRVRIPTQEISDIAHYGYPEDSLDKLVEKVEVMIGGEYIAAEDDEGGICSYSWSDKRPKNKPDVNVREWLGIEQSELK